jgi:phosphoribosylamine--glycine ligase
MGNRVMVVGSGAREHALAWKLTQSGEVDGLIAAPGNPGTALVGENVAVGALDVEGLVGLATERKVDLVVVGPEAPLAAGLADALLARGIAVVGPTRAAARIESSKAWAKELMIRAGVPSARAREISHESGIARALDEFPLPVVVKADGLAAGKGVIIAGTLGEAEEACRGLLSGALLGEPAGRVLIEEFLEGQEVSVFALIDGEHVLPLLPACDYKRVFDDDRGPNTGGMGAYSPVPWLDAMAMRRIEETILRPTVDAMREEGNPMQGILFAGLIMTAEGPMVLEFNARFGDPEAQVILPLLKSDLFPLLQATANGTLDTVPAPVWSIGAAVGVVLASGGYPGDYRTGLPIAGDAPVPYTEVFHAGTARNASGELVTSGGRVMTVVGMGETFSVAAERAYARAETIAFEGKQQRGDIARREIAG